MQVQLGSGTDTDHRSRSGGVLRFITAGSVDDGKSTLIGRLLHDTGGVYEDQLQQLSTARGAQGSTADNLALLTDGLRAEREQGITIDIAHRYFATQHRKFIVIDAPGHVQYTRNMVTGASCAELAVVLVDVREGLVEQSRRHAYLASLLGVRQLLFAVNKMDLVDYGEARYRTVASQIQQWAAGLGEATLCTIPVSALSGDNVVTRSGHMDWYHGPTLLEHLEGADVRPRERQGGFRLPVQWVLQQATDGSPDRGYAGVLGGARVRPGAEVLVLPGGQRTKVREVRTYDGALPQARPGQSITLALSDQVDVSRGDTLCDARQPLRVGSRLEATLAWMGSKPLQLDRPYALRHTSRWLRGQVTRLRHTVDVHTLAHHRDVPSLEVNQIGHVELETSNPLAYDTYDEDRLTGAFILVDEATHETVAAGMLRAPARRDSGTRRGLYLISSGADTPAVCGLAIEGALRTGGHADDVQVLEHGPDRLLDPAPDAGESAVLLVNGRGGWRAPLPGQRTHAEVARKLGLAPVLVVQVGPGCLNHALLTAEAIRRDGLELAGWVIQDEDGTQARALCASLVRELDAPLLGHVASDVAADVDADVDGVACARACGRWVREA